MNATEARKLTKANIPIIKQQEKELKILADANYMKMSEGYFHKCIRSIKVATTGGLYSTECKDMHTYYLQRLRSMGYTVSQYKEKQPYEGNYVEITRTHVSWEETKPKLNLYHNLITCINKQIGVYLLFLLMFIGVRI